MCAGYPGGMNADNVNPVHIDDDYTGDLSRHEVQRFTAGTVDVYKTSVGEMDNNCYLLVDRGAPDRALLIDACDEADHLKSLADAAGATVRTIVTTHSHGDHVQALGELLEAWDARHVASSLDAPDLPADVDRRVDQGDTVTFGDDVDLVAFILRGHTRGGVGLALDEGDGPAHLFVGDSLFPGGVGKTTTQESFAQLLHDVEERIFDSYPGDSVVHPGHGSDTTVGSESPHLEEWRNRGW